MPVIGTFTAFLASEKEQINFWAPFNNTKTIMHSVACRLVIMTLSTKAY